MKTEELSKEDLTPLTPNALFGRFGESFFAGKG